MHIEHTEVRLALTIREAQSLMVILKMINTPGAKVGNIWNRPAPGVWQDAKGLLYELENLLLSPSVHENTNKNKLLKLSSCTCGAVPELKLGPLVVNFFVRCDSCGRRGPFSDSTLARHDQKVQAIEKWNDSLPSKGGANG